MPVLFTRLYRSASGLLRILYASENTLIGRPFGPGAAFRLEFLIALWTASDEMWTEVSESFSETELCVVWQYK